MDKVSVIAETPAGVAVEALPRRMDDTVRHYLVFTPDEPWNKVLSTYQARFGVAPAIVRRGESGAWWLAEPEGV